MSLINAISRGLAKAAQHLDTSTTHNNSAAAASHESVTTVLERFLNSNNCKFTLDDSHADNAGGNVKYYFDYQGGHFIAYVYSNGGIEVAFPRMADFPVDSVDIVRGVCNQANSNSTLYKYWYDMYEDEDVVGVSISYYADVLSEQALERALVCCFYAQRDFHNDLQKAADAAKENGVKDVERDFFENKRELFLVHNQEMRHQDLPMSKALVSHDVALSFNYVMKNMLGKEDVELVGLQVLNDAGLTLKRAAADAALGDLDLASFIVDKKAQSPSFLSATATAVATYHSLMSERTDQTLAVTITMREAGVSDHTAFFRIMVAPDSGDASPRQYIADGADSELPETCTFMMGYDYVSAEQMRAEAEYMWKDAQIKINEKKHDELTEEQQLLLNVSTAPVAYNMYWGRRYMLTDRYFEAIAHFENLYQNLRALFLFMNSDMKRLYYQVVYNLGFCYSKLRLYDKALFYLDMVRDSHSISYTTEYVNVLANSADTRVFKTIEKFLDDIAQQYANAEEMPEAVMRFVSFLNRRYAYSLVEFCKLDEAEKAYKKLLNDPESEDYAMKELAYIQQLKSKDGDAQASE